MKEVNMILMAIAALFFIFLGCEILGIDLIGAINNLWLIKAMGM